MVIMVSLEQVFSWKYLLAKNPCAGATSEMIQIKTAAPVRSNMSASSLQPEVH